MIPTPPTPKHLHCSQAQACMSPPEKALGPWLQELQKTLFLVPSLAFILLQHPDIYLLLHHSVSSFSSHLTASKFIDVLYIP